MLRVIIESPLSGDMERNQQYARLCCLDSLRRGEAPYAGHLLYTQMLDDTIPEERTTGMKAGFSWGKVGELRVFYLDLGWSNGMREGEQQALQLFQPVEHRYLPADLMAQLAMSSIRNEPSSRLTTEPPPSDRFG